MVCGCYPTLGVSEEVTETYRRNPEISAVKHVFSRVLATEHAKTYLGVPLIFDP